MDLSIYGATGIIGTYFNGLFPSFLVPREQLEPETENVLYLISTTDNSTFIENPHIDINTNLVELMRRLEACRNSNVETFNFVSSWFVYGPNHVYPDEQVVCDPNGFYSITKYAAEKLVKEYCQAFGINYRIFRLGNVYGGPDTGNQKRNALHYLINNLREGKDINVHTNVSRDFIHIMDTCRAMEFLCEHGYTNCIYNIGTGLSTKLTKALDKAKKIGIFYGQIHPHSVPQNYNQAVSFGLNCGKLASHGFKPLISFEEGLHDLCLNQKFCTPDPTLMAQKLKQQSPA
jgi:dTDP-glucose 4,6-dehydratase